MQLPSITHPQSNYSVALIVLQLQESSRRSVESLTLKIESMNAILLERDTLIESLKAAVTDANVRYGTSDS